MSRMAAGDFALCVHVHVCACACVCMCMCMCVHVHVCACVYWMHVDMFSASNLYYSSVVLIIVLVLDMHGMTID